LENYLIVASDDHSIYLVDIVYGKIKVIANISLKEYITFVFRDTSAMLRLSVDKKIKDSPILILGLHHSNHIFICHISKTMISAKKGKHVYDYVMKIVKLDLKPGDQDQISQL
jgi:hypothetical protein